MSITQLGTVYAFRLVMKLYKDEHLEFSKVALKLWNLPRTKVGWPTDANAQLLDAIKEYAVKFSYAGTEQVILYWDTLLCCYKQRKCSGLK